MRASHEGFMGETFFTTCPKIRENYSFSSSFFFSPLSYVRVGEIWQKKERKKERKGKVDGGQWSRGIMKFSIMYFNMQKYNLHPKKKKKKSRKRRREYAGVHKCAVRVCI
jgi:hypothetical protein